MYKLLALENLTKSLFKGSYLSQELLLLVAKTAPETSKCPVSGCHSTAVLLIFRD